MKIQKLNTGQFSFQNFELTGRAPMRLFMQIKKEELKKTVLLPKAIYAKKGGS
jgi:hypothetical protein